VASVEVTESARHLGRARRDAAEPISIERAGGRATAFALGGRFQGWLFPLAVSLVLTLLVEGTYLLAEHNVAGAGIFVGQSWAPHDVAQYVAAIDDGRGGALLIHDRLTSEPHQPAFIYGLYVLLGWLARPFTRESIAGYRIAAVVGRQFLLLALYGSKSLV
jgi:hypothetical protein